VRLRQNSEKTLRNGASRNLPQEKVRQVKEKRKKEVLETQGGRKGIDVTDPFCGKYYCLPVEGGDRELKKGKKRRKALKKVCRGSW